MNTKINIQKLIEAYYTLLIQINIKYKQFKLDGET